MQYVPLLQACMMPRRACRGLTGAQLSWQAKLRLQGGLRCQDIASGLELG